MCILNSWWIDDNMIGLINQGALLLDNMYYSKIISVGLVLFVATWDCSDRDNCLTMIIISARSTFICFKKTGIWNFQMTRKKTDQGLKLIQVWRYVMSNITSTRSMPLSFLIFIQQYIFRCFVTLMGHYYIAFSKVLLYAYNCCQQWK